MLDFNEPLYAEKLKKIWKETRKMRIKCVKIWEKPENADSAKLFPDMLRRES